MVFLISLLVGAQILCSLARLPSHHGLLPPEISPPVPDRLISAPCNSSSVKAAAELALDKLNEDRREGYILGLQRIFDVHQLQWQGTGVVYYLTLDVLETDCHVLSKKTWKDCQFRSAHEAIYGQCKATFYINKPWRILHLYNYDCVLHPVPAAVIVRTCPDCPTPGDPTESRFLEAATQSLAKFNEEGNHTHYFKVRSITRARSQWVIGPSNSVEYVIQETSCSKSQAAKTSPDLSSCPFLPDETAEVGVCKGSVVDSRIEHRTFITTNCEIFHPQPRVHEGQQTGDRKPGHQDDEGSHEGAGHSEGGRKGHHDGHSEDRREGHHQDHSEGRREEHHHGHSEDRREEHHHGHSEDRREGHRDNHRGRPHPHDRRHKPHRHHKNESHDHAEHEENPPTSGASETSTDLGKTVGRVEVLPVSNAHVSLHSLPEIEAERLDGVPVPPQPQEPKPIPNLPDIHGAPEESRPLGKPMGRPGLTKPARPITPPPFPAEFSQSNTCPGEILFFVHGLEPLLPKRPVELPHLEVPESQAGGKVKH